MLLTRAIVASRSSTSAAASSSRGFSVLARAATASSRAQPAVVVGCHPNSVVSIRSRLVGGKGSSSSFSASGLLPLRASFWSWAGSSSQPAAVTAAKPSSEFVSSGAPAVVSGLSSSPSAAASAPALSSTTASDLSTMSASVSSLGTDSTLSNAAASAAGAGATSTGAASTALTVAKVSSAAAGVTAAVAAGGQVLSEIKAAGLGGSTPPGWIQTLIENVHLLWGLPWWEAIVAVSFLMRVLVFFPTLSGMRTSEKMRVFAPQLTELQTNLSAAKQSGDAMEMQRAINRLGDFYKAKNLNPLSAMAGPLFTLPILGSMFLAISGMIAADIPSLHAGGAFWFTDLTMKDGYFRLPIIASVLASIQMELAFATSPTKPPAGQLNLFRLFVPVTIMASSYFMESFNNMMLVFVISSTLFNMLQMLILRLPVVRRFFKFPILK